MMDINNELSSLSDLSPLPSPHELLSPRTRPRISINTPSPIIQSIQEVVATIIQASKAQNTSLIVLKANKLQSLIFALSSTLGASLFHSSHEDILWHVITSLWVRDTPPSSLSIHHFSPPLVTSTEYQFGSCTPR